ncbi:MAG: ABC transporter ATP-binding protein [Bacteroidales bacterium]|jgi:lipoprotein-releasing system ATP-binding protein|nr:ABC transporter ATP-binding protein [Bacteroidales bacterium]
MISGKKITKSYGKLKVLKGIDIEIEKEEIVTLIGASGAGKTTLLHILGTLDKPDSGKIIIDNQDISKLSDNELAHFRNQNIGFVFQFHHLLPEFTAAENVCLPALIGGKSKKEAIKEAIQLLDILQIKDRSEHKPATLSGGEQQRVAVARALINHPTVVFADEPSGNLDSENALILHQLFISLRDALHQTFVITTHNPDLVNLADRVLKIKDGIII